jgi:hypothetical protein
MLKQISKLKINNNKLIKRLENSKNSLLYRVNRTPLKGIKIKKKELIKRLKKTLKFKQMRMNHYKLIKMFKQRKFKVKMYKKFKTLNKIKLNSILLIKKLASLKNNSLLKVNRTQLMGIKIKNKSWIKLLSITPRQKNNKQQFPNQKINPKNLKSEK